MPEALKLAVFGAQAHDRLYLWPPLEAAWNTVYTLSTSMPPAGWAYA